MKPPTLLPSRQWTATTIDCAGDSFRYDPNCALPLEDAVRFGRAIADLNNDYFEDPTWGLNGNRQVRAAIQAAAERAFDHHMAQAKQHQHKAQALHRHQPAAGAIQ